jgi:hypothetical protein
MPRLKTLPIIHLQMELRKIFAGHDGNFCMGTLGLPPFCLHTTSYANNPNWSGQATNLSQKDLVKTSKKP